MEFYKQGMAMHEIQETQLTELTALGRGMEALLRRLVRLVIGKIALPRFHELLNQVYVEEVEEQIRSENPDLNVTLAMIALNTGLDTRHISRIRNKPSYGQGKVDEDELLRDLSPAASFLHLWSTDRLFIDENSNAPKPIPLSRPQASLHRIAKKLSLPRGVTIASVIGQLERSGLVRIDPERDLLQWNTGRFLPEPNKDREGALEVGFAAICRLTDTVVHNLGAGVNGEPRLFQRVYWNNRLSPLALQECKDRLTELLGSTESKGIEVLSEMDPGHDLVDQVSAGFGIYYFEDSPSESAASTSSSSSK